MRMLRRVATVEDPDGSWGVPAISTTPGGDRRWPSRRGCSTPAVLNSDRFRRDRPSAGGGDACRRRAALASFYDDVRRADGLVAERLGHDLWRAYVEPAATGHDLVLDRPVIWTLGFQLSEEDGRVELGMGGAGGCSAWTEPAARYGAAYVTRRLGSHDRGEVVWEAVAARFQP